MVVPSTKFKLENTPMLTAIGLYHENAIAVRVIDRSAYDATSRASSAKKLVKLKVEQTVFRHE